MGANQDGGVLERRGGGGCLGQGAVKLARGFAEEVFVFMTKSRRTSRPRRLWQQRKQRAAVSKRCWKRPRRRTTVTRAIEHSKSAAPSARAYFPQTFESTRLERKTRFGYVRVHAHKVMYQDYCRDANMQAERVGFRVLARVSEGRTGRC